MMLSQSVVFFVNLLICSIRPSESLSVFNRSSCRDESVPGVGGLIVNGTVAIRDKWPWLVAFVYKTDDNFSAAGR